LLEDFRAGEEACFVRLVLRVAPERVLDGVFRLLEPGGEDVRVAMVSNVGHRHSCHTHHTGACCSQPSQDNRMPSARKGGRPAIVRPAFTPTGTRA